MTHVVKPEDHNEFCEGLAYNSERGIIAVSSVQVNRNNKYVKSRLYLYKIKDEELLFYGDWQSSYKPTESE
jgi:hypothetical protein